MNQWLLLVPEIILAVTAGGVLLLDLAAPKARQSWLSWLALGGVVLPLAAVWIVPDGNFAGVLVVDTLSRVIKTILLAALGLVVLGSWNLPSRWQRPQGEYLILLLAAGLGMLFLASGLELVLLYVGLELTTFPQVLLTAYRPTDRKSAEGGLKYLFLAALASAILLFGFSLVYAVAGTTQLLAMAQILLGQAQHPVVLLGLLFILAGLGFKIALVPFHTWTPDAYEGAPTPVTAFLSVASKTAGFVLAIRLLAAGFPALRAEWALVLAALAAATMTLGNFAAIPQTNIKRLLAYSSIAQAGFMIMGLEAFQTLGLSSLIFYLAAYLFTNLAAFTVVMAVEHATGAVEISAYHGLAGRSPRLALAMLLALLSLAGIPPLAGFTAKFYLFAAVYNAGQVWLVVLAVLNSALSLYYYLKVIRAIYIEKAPEGSMPMPATAWPLSLVLGVAVLGILLLGVYPAPVVNLARDAVVALLPVH